MLSSLATERKPIQCSIFSSGSLDRNILVRDSFSNHRLDPLVAGRTKKLPQDSTTKHPVQCREADTVKHPRDAQFERYAGEPNLPAQELFSSGSKIVELRRLGTILSF